MSWADRAIEELRAGRATTVRPRGNSMRGRVTDGQVVRLEPTALADLHIDDVVLVRVHGHIYLHLILARDGSRFQIGNNRGRINGWVGPDAIYGVMRDQSPERSSAPSSDAAAPGRLDQRSLSRP